MRRVAAIGCALLVVYGAAMPLNSLGDSSYSGDEPHYLLAAQSLAEDRNLDVLDELRARSWQRWQDGYVEPQGNLTRGRLNEPHSPGLPLLAAPVFGLFGPAAVNLLVVVLAALGGAIAYRLALRVVPDPWATFAALAGGVSPPLFVYGSAVYPDAIAGTALAGAALLALEVSERPTRRRTFACFALLGAVPWLGFKFVPAALVIGWFAVRALRRERRGLLALLGAEVAFFSAAVSVGFNEAVYGGPTPYSAGDTFTGADGVAGYAERAYRLAALLIDREVGLLRWAPVFALALVGAWHGYRGGRERLAAVIPGLRQEHEAGRLCAAAVAAQFLVAAFLAPSVFGLEFPARHLVAVLPLAVPLVAVGFRHAPRAGFALGMLTLAASVWVWGAARGDSYDLSASLPPAPWGPLEVVFPVFDGSVPALAIAIAAALAVAALIAREELALRRPVQPPL